MLSPRPHPGPGFAAVPILTATLLLACAGSPAPASADAGTVGHAHALTAAPTGGRGSFERALPGSNGRSCATCHVLDEASTLRPASVTARLAANPRDPLFHPLDADDPTAAVPTYAHLEKGLVRVVLPLPANMDVLDTEGNVVTPKDRTIFVWRGVPTVADTAATGPHQYDGRAPSLEEQARAAFASHSELADVASADLDAIARFERAQFSSWRGRFVGTLHALGVPVAKIPMPEDYVPLTPEERRGRQVYKAACEGCHGGATTDRIVNRELQGFFFPALDRDGHIRFEVVPGKGPVPVRLSRPGVEFMNIGTGIASYWGQIKRLPAFNDSVELPRYRFRFYRDGSRREKLVDLPPLPRTVSGDPLDPRPARDARGLPIVGPNFIPQLFSTDPGRAAITGDPADFEAFDMPPLRGIAATAPYFHDNSHATLRDVVDSYSRFILPSTTPLGLPAVHPPEPPSTRKESLSLAQKIDLLAFLEQL